MRCKELRFNRRQPVNIGAYIVWNGRLIEATVKNCSLQGVLLECLKLSAPLHIQIKIYCIIEERCFEIGGNITHIYNGKVGVTFETPQHDFLHTTQSQTHNMAITSTALQA